jgi:hypothetical protein
MCSICLSECIAEKAELQGCANHVFCYDCIRTWICYSGKTCCPVCSLQLESIHCPERQAVPESVQELAQTRGYPGGSKITFGPGTEHIDFSILTITTNDANE